MTLSKFKQSGNFSVEFAIVGVFFAVMLAFSGDIIIKLSTKGKLERLSFSLVNVLKERTRLYGDFTPKDDEAEAEAIQLEAIAVSSLGRTLGGFDAEKFGILVEAQTYTQATADNLVETNDLQTYKNGQECIVSRKLDHADLRELSVVTSWNRQTSFYRVTLCYNTNDWYGRASGGSFPTLINSSSVMIGR